MSAWDGFGIGLGFGFLAACLFVMTTWSITEKNTVRDCYTKHEVILDNRVYKCTLEVKS